ncbi:hypothetical protein KUTeg_018794 [Tegillarca granosa]|uniref:HTH psq-type domain-containing protein n=1 Tax=Tegillarca granosa TaxID=220873 RepID=A0ABQ9EEF0_TEGGR|nr:hypothetical protein KUTeg_018794 [Tegillarca granosa]
MSVYKAARTYGVPGSTLRDRTRGNVDINVSRGFDTIFTTGEEQILHSHIKYMANIGYGYNKLGVQTLARDYALSLNKDLKSAKALTQKLSFSRAQSASREKLNNYYKELSSLMTKHNLTDRPDRIYNTCIDETGINTQHKPLKIGI